MLRRRSVAHAAEAPAAHEDSRRHGYHVGDEPLTLVVTPLLAGALAFSALLTFAIVVDGESNWLEGIALIGLYVIIAASVWWGPPIAV